MRHAATILIALMLMACSGDGSSTATTPTTVPPVSPTTTAPITDTDSTPPSDPSAPPTTVPITADGAVPSTTLPPATTTNDVSFIVANDDGVSRDGQVVVHGGVAWADDDELSGVVYLPAGDDATIRWLPAGANQPIDTGLQRGLVGTSGTGPALVTFGDAPMGEQCGDIVSDGEVHAVNARALDPAIGVGSPTLITCNAEGADDGYLTLSYRDGHLLQVHTEAAAWKYSDRELVLVGPGGDRLEMPDSTFGQELAWWEQQRELDGELSPDASLIAVRQRLDNAYSNGPNAETGEIDVDEWERLTAAIPSTIRVVELGTGTIRYETQAPYGVELGDFDGRHLSLIDGSRSTIVDTLGETPPTTVPGTVVFTRPTADSQGRVLPTTSPVTVRPSDAGTWVSHLQLRLLIHDPSTAVSVDGQFGPATESAVTAFQRRHGLEPDGIAGPNTWAALLTAPLGKVVGADDENRTRIISLEG